MLLDFWLSSMLDCIHFCVFLFHEKLFLHILTTSRYLSTARLSIEPLFSSCLDRSYHNLNPSSFLDFFLIASRQLLDPLRNFLSAQQMLNSCSIHRDWLLLNLLRSSCMHCFSHVLHLSFILSSIASCFITFMYLYGFFVLP